MHLYELYRLGGLADVHVVDIRPMLCVLLSSQSLGNCGWLEGAS